MPFNCIVHFFTGGQTCHQYDFLDLKDKKGRVLRENVFASRTKKTYKSQENMYLDFCQLAGFVPTTLSTDNVCRYITYLSERLAFISIKLYINPIRIIHLEEGFDDPFAKSSHIDYLLKCAKRCMGMPTN